ncbi:MAG: hypothetical protein WBF17_04045 [Phycisphaerae bacterium]
MAEDSILEPDEEPISLVDSQESSGFATGGVKTFGIAGGADAEKHEYKRPLNTDGSGATRCRTFHSKIAIASLEFMENQINDWLDSDKIEVKHVGHVIGIMEGKRPEPNLLVMVWY